VIHEPEEEVDSVSDSEEESSSAWTGSSVGEEEEEGRDSSI